MSLELLILLLNDSNRVAEILTSLARRDLRSTVLQPSHVRPPYLEHIPVHVAVPRGLGASVGQSQRPVPPPHQWSVTIAKQWQVVSCLLALYLGVLKMQKTWLMIQPILSLSDILVLLGHVCISPNHPIVPFGTLPIEQFTLSIRVSLQSLDVRVCIGILLS